MFVYDNIQYGQVIDLQGDQNSQCTRHELTPHLVSEWVLFNTKWAIFHLYHGKNKLHFNEMVMMWALY